MKIKKTKAEVTNVNPRKEKGSDGDVLASDVSVHFVVPRAVVDALFPKQGNKHFTDQFYNGEDTRLEVVYPIIYQNRIEDLMVKLTIGDADITFAGARIASGMKLTPEMGQHVKVECKLQVHPTRSQSGKLDAAVKEWIELKVDPMTDDMLKKAAA